MTPPPFVVFVTLLSSFPCTSLKLALLRRIFLVATSPHTKHYVERSNNKQTSVLIGVGCAQLQSQLVSHQRWAARCFPSALGFS